MQGDREKQEEWEYLWALEVLWLPRIWIKGLPGLWKGRIDTRTKRRKIDIISSIRYQRSCLDNQQPSVNFRDIFWSYIPFVIYMSKIEERFKRVVQTQWSEYLTASHNIFCKWFNFNTTVDYTTAKWNAWHQQTSIPFMIHHSRRLSSLFIKTQTHT